MLDYFSQFSIFIRLMTNT